MDQERCNYSLETWSLEPNVLNRTEVEVISRSAPYSSSAARRLRVDKTRCRDDEDVVAKVERRELEITDDSGRGQARTRWRLDHPEHKNKKENHGDHQAKSMM